MILRLGIIFERKVLNYNDNSYNVYKAIDVVVGGFGIDDNNCTRFSPLKKRCTLYCLDRDNKKNNFHVFDNYTYYVGIIDVDDFYNKYYFDNVNYNFLVAKEEILKEWDGYFTLGNEMELNRIITGETVKECEKLFGVNDNYKDNNKIGVNYNILKKYGKFLTNKDFLSNPAIDRESEIEKLEIALLSIDKSPLLVGEAGVGKTAIVEGLAYKIKNGLVPEKLKNIEILSINTSSLISGCKYVGMVEERLNEIISELEKNKNVILFIDEIHTVIGAGTGSKSNLDVANILKPFLDRGDIKVIGATTNLEYENIINDIAFRRRFKKINVNEQNERSLFNVINEVICGLEIHYNINFNFEDKKKDIIEYLIRATDVKYRDYRDRVSNPDLVLSIIKDAFSIADLYSHKEVLIEDIIKALNENDRIYDSIRDEYSYKLNELFKVDNSSINQNRAKVLKLEDYK